MIVGLGTGSTAAFFVEELGRRVKEEGLDIVGVTTSNVTSQQAASLNIPLKSIDEVDYVDLTVDGADEIDTALNGIKGGGAALLMEKSLQHILKIIFGLLMKVNFQKILAVLKFLSKLSLTAQSSCSENLQRLVMHQHGG